MMTQLSKHFKLSKAEIALAAKQAELKAYMAIAQAAMVEGLKCGRFSKPDGNHFSLSWQGVR